MKPGLPWSVKGIEPDVREAAKLAARRSGMTLGEWLNSTIMEQADGTPPQEAPVPALSARPRGAAGMPAIERAASRLEDIAEKLARLSIGESATAARIGIHAASERDDAEAFTRVLSRVENNERQTVEAITAVNERIAGLSRQFTAASRPQASRVEDSQSFQALEKAVRSIVEHMETSEKRTKETFKSLQDRIASLGTKAQTSDNDQFVRQAPAFSALETRLADLAKRVERSESSTQHQSLSDLLRREITDLAKRIDQVREHSETLASKAQTQAVQASQHELRAIENRILGLLKEAQSSLAGANAGPAEIQRLRGEIERLNRRIDETAQPGSGPEVLELRAAVEQLSTRVAQGPDMRPLADMDRRILDITQRLEQTQAATRSMPQFAELENRIAELDYKFSEAMAGRGSSHAAEIDERIAEVSERLSRTEQQLSSLETIERAVNQLFDTVEQQRKWTEEVAEGAASRMAQQILAAGPQQVSLAGSPEIQALENGLTAVRTAAETADQRNQETLEAVHDTLEQIVTKLAELETATIGQRVAAAAAAPLMEQAAPVASEFAASPSSNPFEEALLQSGMPAAGQPMAEIQPAPEGLESAPAFNPFEVAPQAAVNPFAPVGSAPQADSFAGSDDFIAAARRAAQAASQQKSILAGISPGAAKISEESSKRLLNLPFFKKKPQGQPQHGPVGLAGEIKPPPGFKAANSNTENKRRKLLLMGLVLLAAVSAFTFNMVGRSHKAKAPVAPAAIEQSIEQGSTTAPAPLEQSAPAAPVPAPLESGALETETDPILTGSLPQTLGTKPISALVAGEAAAPENLPPAEVGAMALREAAALGDPTAQFVIATRYLNGEKVQQDYEKAAYWYGKAAAQGSAPAQYRLATMYERGRGVAKDLKAALGWYERSAGLGNVKSMHNAAVLASGNELGAPDYKRAYKWFSLGAAHGLKDSQYNLAVLLERGLGTEANKSDAWFWYSVAGQQQDGDAAKRASVLAKALTQGELLAAKTRLAAWSPEKAPDTANVIAINNADWNVQMSVGG
jgi:localization factor PodJL